MNANPSPLPADPGSIAVIPSDKSAAPREQILSGAIYLTNEAAKLCRVQPSTIRQAVRSGRIRGQGRPFRILGAELLKLV